MSLKLSGAIIVSTTYWKSPILQAAWKKILDKNLSDYKVFTVDRNFQDIRREVTRFLNEISTTQAFFIDTRRTTPELFSSFYSKAIESGKPLVLHECTLPKLLLSSLSAKLHFGQMISPYSSFKLLPVSLCYNLRPSDISFVTDQSILKLANLMKISIGSVHAGLVSRKRHLLHSVASKIVNFISPARPYHLLGKSNENMLGAGMVHRGQTFITHTNLKEHHSAANTFTLPQNLLGLSIFLLILLGLVTYPRSAMIGFTAVLSFIYFVDVLFNLFLVGKSLKTPPELSFTDKELDEIKDNDLPVYTILVPLYKEANILPGFVESISKMDYPQSKLDVLLLLEADDLETIRVAESLNLPKFIRPIVVPHSFPKTKPKACNYGLAFAKGENIVIYDAEDHPDPRQLKKAYLGFKVSPPEVACLQAKLNYHNLNQNLLTRFFTAEYSLWFDVVLPGLQSINTTIPLGGTSNHFRTKDIIKFKGWDAFNVTEDADLGTRLFKAGYRTAIVDSVTLEEANSKVGNWIRQRSRWIKGYMQTYLVHNRNLGTFIKNQGWHALIFQLTVGGKIAFMLINPFLWVMTISYFALYAYVGPTIESFYPPVVFYMAAFSLVFGNFLFMYYYMIGIAKHGHWTLIKYVFLVPLYWILISRAALKALYQLMVKPHYWEKTTHGLHLTTPKAPSTETLKEKFTNSSKKKKNYLAIFFLTAILTILNKIQKIIELNSETKISNSKARLAFTKVYYHPHAGTVLLVIASVIGNFLNFLYSAYLGNSISFEQFGLISLFGGFLYLTQIPFSVFSSSVTQESAYYFGKEKAHPKYIWRQFRRWALYVSSALTLTWIVALPWLKILFKGDSIVPFLFFTPVWIIGMLSAVDSGFLNGTHRFKVLAVLCVSEAIAKLLFSVFFVVLNLKEYIYLALPLSMALSFLIGWYYANLVPENKNQDSLKDKVIFPLKFAGTVVLNRLSIVAFLGLDILIAKVVLSPDDAGRFALVSLIGKIVYFFSSLAGGFILPMVSKEEGASGNPKYIFRNIFLVTLFFTVFSYLCLGIFGWFFAPLLFGSKMASVVHHLPFYLLGIASFTLSSVIISYHQSRRKYFIGVLSFFITIVQLFLVIDLAHDLGTFCYFLGMFGIIQLFIVSILHRLTRYSTIITQNSYAFFNLFKKQRTTTRTYHGQIRFLILNWRDTKHIWAGGAEVYVHELAKNLVDKGHQVTLFCGNDGKSKNSEVIDGVEVIRRGGFFTVYLWAAVYYLFKFQDRFDIIIDSENGIPFFTPLYSRRPKFLLVHHVHQEFFRENLSFPALQIACFLEKQVMPRVYAQEKVVTVSDSSAKDVLKLGIFDESNICIVNPGVEVKIPKKKTPLTDYPSIVYLGRLKSYKNVDIAIKAFKKVLRQFPDAILNIAGEGECSKDLLELTKKLKIDDSVHFHGRISELEKSKLYQKSWIAIQPSSFEGWGITVIEANLFGTPVIASDIAGLRDSVVKNKTGLLVKPKHVVGFANAITKLIRNKKLRESMSISGIERAKKFNWSENTDIFLSAINRYYIDLNYNESK